MSGVARTVVQFAQLTEEDLAWYVASGEPRDKAGAYGIQGLASRFIERIEGSYPNVVGSARGARGPAAAATRRAGAVG